MSDVIGLSEVSSKDTGRGSKLKTGGKRRYNMPKECVAKMIAKGMSRKDANKFCYKDNPPKAQKAGESATDQKDRVGWDMAGSKNARMKKRIKKRANSINN